MAEQDPLSTGRPASDDRRSARSRSPGYETVEVTEVFVISVAAQLAGMHPQTLRQYDRLGLVQPQRASGGGRRYSARDVELLKEINRLSQIEGVNLAGVKRIIDLESHVDTLSAKVGDLLDQLSAAERRIADLEAALRSGYRRTDLMTRRQTALVVWRPQQDQ